eukprot:TRINITY_DN773194_c0_g1_i1.p1 TRINITY_DN773194_c0_g1~~TRINITY_DN773194_c0_g1_i1.p1  ORF type:complete len:178 (-),score=44.22 TRINITY_DN773194_c0_g1_i1:33-566(-)
MDSKNVDIREYKTSKAEEVSILGEQLALGDFVIAKTDLVQIKDLRRSKLRSKCGHPKTWIEGETLLLGKKYSDLVKSLFKTTILVPRVMKNMMLLDLSTSKPLLATVMNGDDGTILEDICVRKSLYDDLKEVFESSKSVEATVAFFDDTLKEATKEELELNVSFSNGIIIDFVTFSE